MDGAPLQDAIKRHFPTVSNWSGDKVDETLYGMAVRALKLGNRASRCSLISFFLLVAFDLLSLVKLSSRRPVSRYQQRAAQFTRSNSSRAPECFRVQRQPTRSIATTPAEAEIIKLDNTKNQKERNRSKWVGFSGFEQLLVSVFLFLNLKKNAIVCRPVQRGQEVGEEAGSLQLKLKTELRCTGEKEKVMTFHCRSQTLVNLLASQKNTTQQPDRVNYIAIADWPLRCTTSRVPQFHWTGIPSDSEDKNQPQRCSDVVFLSG